MACVNKHMSLFVKLFNNISDTYERDIKLIACMSNHMSLYGR